MSFCFPYFQCPQIKYSYYISIANFKMSLLLSFLKHSVASFAYLAGRRWELRATIGNYFSIQKWVSTFAFLPFCLSVCLSLCLLVLNLQMSVSKALFFYNIYRDGFSIVFFLLQFSAIYLFTFYFCLSFFYCFIRFFCFSPSVCLFVLLIALSAKSSFDELVSVRPSSKMGSTRGLRKIVRKSIGRKKLVAKIAQLAENRTYVKIGVGGF
jgi:hypothetical protein